MLGHLSVEENKGNEVPFTSNIINKEDNNCNSCVNNSNNNKKDDEVDKRNPVIMNISENKGEEEFYLQKQCDFLAYMFCNKHMKKVIYLFSVLLIVCGFLFSLPLMLVHTYDVKVGESNGYYCWVCVSNCYFHNNSTNIDNFYGFHNNRTDADKYNNYGDKGNNFVDRYNPFDCTGHAGQKGFDYAKINYIMLVICSTLSIISSTWMFCDITIFSRKRNLNSSQNVISPLHLFLAGQALCDAFLSIKFFVSALTRLVSDSFTSNVESGVVTTSCYVSYFAGELFSIGGLFFYVALSFTIFYVLRFPLVFKKKVLNSKKKPSSYVKIWLFVCTVGSLVLTLTPLILDIYYFNPRYPDVDNIIGVTFDGTCWLTDEIFQLMFWNVWVVIAFILSCLLFVYIICFDRFQSTKDSKPSGKVDYTWSKDLAILYGKFIIAFIIIRTFETLVIFITIVFPKSAQPPHDYDLDHTDDYNMGYDDYNDSSHQNSWWLRNVSFLSTFWISSTGYVNSIVYYNTTYKGPNVKSTWKSLQKKKKTSSIKEKITMKYNTSKETETSRVDC